MLSGQKRRTAQGMTLEAGTVIATGKTGRLVNMVGQVKS